MLAALHAQVVKGECAGGGEECALAAGCVLPARLAQPALPAPAVRLHHLALRGTPPHLAMQRALTLASSWPLTRATIFDVMVSTPSLLVLHLPLLHFMSNINSFDYTINDPIN